MNTVRIHVDDISTVLETYESIKLYRASNAEDVSTGATLVTTITLVAGTEDYSYEDTGGAIGDWYAHTYYHSTGPVQSTLSERYTTRGNTLEDLLYEAARKLQASSKGVVDSATTTTIVDAQLSLFGRDTRFANGSFIWRPSETNIADQVNRVASLGFAAATGTLTMIGTYPSAPDAADVYYIFDMHPPIPISGSTYSWLEALNEAIVRCKWIDRLNVGPGDGTYPQTVDLAAHLGYIEPELDIRKVWAERTSGSTTLVRDLTSEGRFFTRIPDDGAYRIQIFASLSTSDTVYLEARRRGVPMFAYNDVTTCPRELVVAETALQMARHMTRNGRGEYSAQALTLEQELVEVRGRYARTGAIIL